MRTWLLTVGEPLPTDTGGARSWRTGLLAEELVRRGHDVVWWSSAFDHFSRRLRAPIDAPVSVAPGLTVWHLSGVPYRRNVSIARLRNHRQVADGFRRMAGGQPKPDVILSSLPTLELSAAAVDYGADHHVPVALDIRDLWPDVLVDLLPAFARPIAPIAVHWMTRDLRHAARGAAAILGVTDEFVRWGLVAAKRAPTDRDRAFAMGYSARMPEAGDQERARVFWRAKGFEDGSPRNIVCFFGTLGWMFDFDTVFDAARLLKDKAPEVVIVICGDGGSAGRLARQVKGLPNVVMPGRVGPAEVWELMRRSIAGLAPYRPYSNFENNLPNKPIEYLAGGLPLVACRLGVLSRLIERRRCGLTYAHGDARGLADAIVTIAGNAEMKASMSARAVETYREEFVAERVYADMARHLEMIAATPPEMV